jgi:hypothetical protein
LGPPLALTRLTRGLAVGKGRQALVVMCPPAGVLSTAPQVSRDAMGWCEEASLTLTLTPTPTLTLMESSRVSPPQAVRRWAGWC